jgi:hypothetical protein
MAKLLAAVALLAGGVREDMDNPQYKAWSKCKPGAFVKFKMTTEVAGTKTESEMTTKLVELSAEKAVVETAMVFGGNALPGAKQEIPAKIKKVEGQANVEKPKEGEEEIEVAGKKVKAKWVESTIDAGGTKTVSKVWMSDEVPGGTVKVETKGPASTSMVAVEWKKE